MALQVAFWILAVIGVMSALTVIIIKDVFRAAMALVMTFLAVAGIYVTLNAEYLAVVQVLIYVGAVSILIIMAIMLTQEVQRGSLDNRLKIPAFGIAGLFLAILLFSIFTTSWPVSGTPPQTATSDNLAMRLFGENGFALPVEIAAMLLLASIIGAITLVKEK